MKRAADDPELSMGRGRVLVLDDDPDACAMLDALLSNAGFRVEATTSVTGAMERLSSFGPDVLLTDVQMPEASGFVVMEQARLLDPRLAVVFVTGRGTVSDAVRALHGGAEHYLVKPINDVELVSVLGRTLDRKRRSSTPPHPCAAPDARPLVGTSEPMRTLREKIARYGPRRATVLLTGETGTGKERVAEALHAASPRAAGPFVRVHCAALSESLLESELFGHERGAFTGAHARRAGRFEQADGGTLFLDEVGEIPPAVQVKLLRVLQDRAFERVGGNDTVAVDVRLIAATHRDLRAMVRGGTFREDLYYRLDVLPLEVPPLRARREDIPLLVQYILARHAGRGERPRVVSSQSMRALAQHDWPGNVRELENLIEQALALSDGHELTLPSPGSRPSLRGGGDAPTVPGATFQEVERHAILSTLEACGHNVTRAAEVLGLSPRTLHYRLREYQGKPGRRS